MYNDNFKVFVQQSICRTSVFQYIYRISETFYSRRYLWSRQYFENKDQNDEDEWLIMLGIPVFQTKQLQISSH